MNTTHKPAANLRLQPDEIRRIVAVGMERGLIHGPNTPLPVEKNGTDATQLDGVRSQWMDVTPELAARWLKNNFGNRSMREDTVKAYARDMVNDLWVPTHQGIAFNDEDRLIDGQHRLSAIVMSAKTVRMMVTFGLPSRIDGKKMTTMDAVDRGATRSVADQLTIQHGFKNGSVTAAICAALSGLCYGERTRRLSVGQTLDVFHEFEQAIQYVIEHRSKQVGLRTTGVLAGFAFALATESNFPTEKTKITSMFERVMTGEGLPDHSALKLLRNFLTSDEAKLFMRSLDRGLGELVLQAIYLELHNMSVTKLELDPAGVEHFRGLQRDRVEKISNIFRLPVAEKKAAVTNTLAAPTPAAAPSKPSMDELLRRVESTLGIARAIIQGKGNEDDIQFARCAFIAIALDAGHGPGTVAAVAKRSVEFVHEAKAWLNAYFEKRPKKRARFEQLQPSK